jgi:predicted NUDIX family NTP pyrophosphohydrolase
LELVLCISLDGIDKDFFTTKQDLYKQVFPELDFIGWYTTAERNIDQLNKQVFFFD